MSNEKKNDGGPAFPNVPTDTQNIGSWDMGMTLRQYACIHLRVPETGEEWLDDIIRKAQKDDFAAKADLGKAEFSDLGVAEWLMGRKMPTDDVAETIGWQAELTAKLRYMMADAMIKAREE